MTWALQQQVVIDPTGRHVLLCLANYADTEGDSMFPSIDALCRDTGRSERTVQYTLRALEAAGVIGRSDPALAAAKIKRGDKRPTVYRLCMDCEQAQMEGPPRGAMVAPREAAGCNQQQNGVQPIAPDPSLTEKNLSHACAREEDEKAAAPPFPVTWQPSQADRELLVSKGVTVSADEFAAMVAAFCGHWAGRPLEPERIQGEFLKWAGRWAAFDARDRRETPSLPAPTGPPDPQVSKRAMQAHVATARAAIAAEREACKRFGQTFEPKHARALLSVSFDAAVVDEAVRAEFPDGASA